MGLDMYVEKRAVAEGHDVEKVMILADRLGLVKNQEELYDLIANDGEKLDTAYFFTMGNETPEEKRERLLKEIPEQLARMEEQYQEAKSMMTPENIVLAESFSSSEVAYWRKANHIHSWFVNNVQDEEDDCGCYLLSQDDMCKLIALCQSIVDIADDASLSDDDKESRYESLLPTQGGFFFGGTDYDEYYLGDIKDTIKQLSPLVETELQPHEQYHYSSSW